MVIECSSCHARFKLADDKIKQSGTKVRCTKCREVFTVFPENPLPVALPVIAVAPSKQAPPVVTPQQEEADDSFFSGTDSTPFRTEIIPTAADIPVGEEEDWNQAAADNLFSDGFADEAGASDLDAISFDDIEAPVFSVSDDKESKFGLSDEAASSFTESFPESGSNQTYQMAEENDLSGETGESEDLNPFNAVTTESDFTFSGGDNLADLSWNEPFTSPSTTTATEQPVNTGAAPEDTAFDFSSFSFDDVVPSGNPDEKKSDETVARSDGTIELSMGTGAAPAPIETILPPNVEDASPPAKDRQERTQRPTRPLRPRVRPKNKGTSRLAVKIITVILLVLAATYGIINRGQIERTYKNIVNNFIEKQTRVETSGRIGLIKLSGSYVHNDKEGDLFVIRGEAVNEYKGLRSSVLVKGTIYGDNGEMLQSQTAYCGNPIKDSKLKEASFKEMRDIMNNELGVNLVNLNIAAGKGIPFTIVFNKTPKNIKEFTVEVLESKPGSK